MDHVSKHKLHDGAPQEAPAEGWSWPPEFPDQPLIGNLWTDLRRTVTAQECDTTGGFCEEESVKTPQTRTERLLKIVLTRCDTGQRGRYY